MLKKFVIPTFFLVFLTLLVIIYLFKQDEYHPCDELDSSASYLQVQCWEQTANKIVKEGGVQKAFRMLPVFLAKNPNFGENCHEYLHQTGHYAYNYYWDYKNGKEFVIPSEASSCGYGFYHGLMSGVLSQGVGVVDAKLFCNYLQKKYGDPKQTLLGNCYHGIGHGIAPTNVNWQNPQTEVSTSIEMCKSIGEKYRECVIAVFGDVSQKYISEVLAKEMPDYTKHSIEEYPNIYNVCRFFPDHLSECIPAFSSYGIDTSKRLIDLLAITTALGDNDSRSYATETIARTYSRKSNADQNIAIINDCTNLKLKSERDACLTGIISGKIETVSTGMESKAGNDFCSTAGLKVNQINECQENLSNLLKKYY